MWWSLSRSVLIGPGVPVREATRPGLDASLHEDGSLEPRDEEVGALDDGLQAAHENRQVSLRVIWTVTSACQIERDSPLP